MATIEYLGTDKPVNQTHPKVSVCITTYRHADYIEQCLQGALAQETDFSYEILVGEDDSNDGTREICMVYAERHPDKIRLFLHDRKDNYQIAGKPTGKNNFLNNLKESRGEYLAFCDGDDYWTSPRKLGLQVQALEAHSDTALCFHASGFVLSTREVTPAIEEPTEQAVLISAAEILRAGGGIVPMNTMMIHKKLVPYLIKYGEEVAGMHFFTRNLGAVLSPGGVAYVPQVMGYYRKDSSASIMTTLVNTQQGKFAWTQRTLRMLNIIAMIAGDEFQLAIHECKKQLVLATISSGLVTVKNMIALCRSEGISFLGFSAVTHAFLGVLRRIRFVLMGYLFRGANPET